jgi:predicted O-linked N-acetylglucosamine transferase (SPINDLY family)
MKKQSNIARTRRRKVHLLAQSGRFEKAISLCEKICRKEVDDLESWSLLGRLYKQVGRQGDVIRCFQHIVEFNPSSAVAYSNLAGEYIHQNNVALAAKNFQQAILLRPDDPKLHTNYGYVLANQQKHSEAELRFRKALQLDPSLSLVYSSLADCLMSQGKLNEAISCYEKGLANSDNDIVMHSNYLLSRHYLSDQNPAENLEAHKKWVQRHIKNEGEFLLENIEKIDVDKVLRIGYVSPDFRMHSVAYFLSPLFKSYNRNKFKVYCYSNVRIADHITKTLRNTVDFWRDTVNMTDDEMEISIRSDNIDILVDLSGHTAGNRLPVFAKKPAPIQITWLGYPDTSGLNSMDYRISDALADPIGFEDAYTEKLYRLEGCFICYEALSDFPPVSCIPLKNNKYITFGSFNNLSKINDSVLEVWASLLKRVPGSRLLIKNPGLTDPSVREHHISIFKRNGISSQRVQLKGLSSTIMEHLSEYNNVDIALDTFPYNGTTTTCEALWMGVPVLTLTGVTHANCVGSSLLTAVGLTEWITETTDEYVDRAVTFANTPDYLEKLRMVTRENMCSSKLCNGKLFSEKMENMYREVWSNLCSRL